MRIKKLSMWTLAVTVLLSGPAYAETFNSSNTIVISREITGATMQPVIGKVLELISSPKLVPNLNIIISSPGGSVTAGFIFTSLLRDLKARGTTITCYVPWFAASMAFGILTQCSKRIVLKEAMLLWHRARVMTGDQPITGPVASVLARDLAATDAVILQGVMDTVGQEMSEQDVKYYFEVETLHIGSNLCAQVPKFCTAVDSVPGMFKAMVSNDIVHAEAAFSPFGKIVETLYIWSRALEAK